MEHVVGVSFVVAVAVSFAVADAVLCDVADCSPPRNEIYFLAVVDILTHYGVKKRTAQAAKTVKHGAGAEISTVRPDQYAKRFLEFVERIVVE